MDETLRDYTEGSFSTPRPFSGSTSTEGDIYTRGNIGSSQPTIRYVSDIFDWHVVYKAAYLRTPPSSSAASSSSGSRKISGASVVEQHYHYHAAPAATPAPWYPRGQWGAAPHYDYSASQQFGQPYTACHQPTRRHAGPCPMHWRPAGFSAAPPHKCHAQAHTPATMLGSAGTRLSSPSSLSSSVSFHSDTSLTPDVVGHMQVHSSNESGGVPSSARQDGGDTDNYLMCHTSDISRPRTDSGVPKYGDTNKRYTHPLVPKRGIGANRRSAPQAKPSLVGQIRAIAGPKGRADPTASLKTGNKQFVNSAKGEVMSDSLVPPSGYTAGRLSTVSGAAECSYSSLFDAALFDSLPAASAPNLPNPRRRSLPPFGMLAPPHLKGTERSLPATPDPRELNGADEETPEVSRPRQLWQKVAQKHGQALARTVAQTTPHAVEKGSGGKHSTPQQQAAPVPPVRKTVAPSGSNDSTPSSTPVCRRRLVRVGSFGSGPCSPPASVKWSSTQTLPADIISSLDVESPVPLPVNYAALPGIASRQRAARQLHVHSTSSGSDTCTKASPAVSQHSEDGKRMPKGALKQAGKSLRRISKWIIGKRTISPPSLVRLEPLNTDLVMLMEPTRPHHNSLPLFSSDAMCGSGDRGSALRGCRSHSDVTPDLAAVARHLEAAELLLGAGQTSSSTRRFNVKGCRLCGGSISARSEGSIDKSVSPMDRGFASVGSASLPSQVSVEQPTLSLTPLSSTGSDAVFPIQHGSPSDSLSLSGSAAEESHASLASQDSGIGSFKRDSSQRVVLDKKCGVLDAIGESDMGSPPRTGGAENWPQRSQSSSTSPNMRREHFKQSLYHRAMSS